MEYENTFVREVKEKNITKPEDILNWYRNLYRTEDNHTEHGIMAYAINDYFADVVPKSEVIRCKDCINCDHCYPVKTIGEEAVEGWYCISHKRYVKPDDFCSFAELKKKYTESLK